jgi:hypothetical protein
MEPVISCLLYLDPYSGSLAYQILVGGILTAVTCWRKPWQKLAEWIRRIRIPGSESLH